MSNIHQAGFTRVTVDIEVAVGSHQLGIHFFQEIVGLVPAFGMLINVQTGYGMERRHCDSARQHAVWHLPEIGLRKIVAQCLIIENNLREHAVFPLVFK